MAVGILEHCRPRERKFHAVRYSNAKILNININIIGPYIAGCSGEKTA
jgi:hypothetical protein